MKRVDLKAPAFDLSDYELPKIDLRNLELPKFDMPRIDMKKIDMSNVEIPDLATIRRFGRPKPRSNPIWPWAVVFMGATLFAGWWLATSTVTGPKVRKLAGRARQRLETMRTPRDQMDGADGEAASAGWASDLDWHESAESGQAAVRPHTTQ